MTRISTPLKYNWKFTRTRTPDALETDCDDSSWETVRVPHDWAIAGPFDREHDVDRRVVQGHADVEASVTVSTGRSGGLPHVGEGWYRREITIPAGGANKRFRLECDGIMSHSTVYCNGRKAGSWPYGYSSFAFDLTGLLQPGERNVIAVHVNNPSHSSRWYPGAGIYRQVRLVTLSPVHIDHWGVHVTTPEISPESGTVRVRTSILNHGADQAVTLRTIISDPAGVEVARTESRQDVSGKAVFDQSLAVANPQRWSLEVPQQYTVHSELLTAGGDASDSLDTRFGFRTLRFDPNLGFFLNEQSLKMNGVCMHHDLGPLGAAVNAVALRRQLTLLKEMGCNAIRTSHNPPDPALPTLCSAMGLLVIDEAFDEWKHPKMRNGYNNLWEEWAEKDLRALIKRDRNHPAVIMWSIGNEIAEQCKDHGPAISRFLVDICHDEDPTRPTTAGLNRGLQTIVNGFAQTLDIPGWNYMPQDYAHAHTQMPDKPNYGSETASTVSSRGEYYFPAVDEMHVRRQTLQVNSYDLSYPSWATAPDIEFLAQDQLDFIMGEFVWTGFDYLGEPTPYTEEWPSRSSYFGIIDLGGLPKDRFYLYQSRWSGREVLHLMPHWTWPGHEGLPVPVQCYTSFHSVELFVNGKSMGRLAHRPQHKLLESSYRFIWHNVPYEAGIVKVVAYDRNGVAQAEKSIQTAGQPGALALVCDRASLAVDGEDMAFATFRVVDEKGVLCPSADNSIVFAVDGPAEIAGVCNGDATSLESFKGTGIRAFNGMCVVYLRSIKGAAGKITLTATSEGLAMARMGIDGVAEEASTGGM